MKKDIFNMPNPVTIMGRSSSITNSFVNGIIPVIEPTEEQIKEALDVLQQNENDVRCVYCGDKKTEWDHLYPLIKNKKHTGYITEIANLVPACGKCNQSKGNSDWKEWMLSNAEKSPKRRGIPDLDRRIEIIEKYDAHFQKQMIDLEELAGKDLWSKYQRAYESIIFTMESAQKLMDEIKQKISNVNDFSNRNLMPRERKLFVVNTINKNEKENEDKELEEMLEKLINLSSAKKRKAIQSEGKISKNDAIELIRNSGIDIMGQITFASLNSGVSKYWANPSSNNIYNDWWLILNDTSSSSLYVFLIPANSISDIEIVTRADKPEKIDLQIDYYSDDFMDTRSGISFKEWLVDEIDY